jgi:hypothetical protein
MAFSDWLVIGTVAYFIRKGAKYADQQEKELQQIEEEEKELLVRELEQRVKYEEERKKHEAESNRVANISEKRKNTPCKFKDGITYEEFSSIAYKAGKRIKRIKETLIVDAVVYCTVESQRGCSVWYFHVDFNDWGHVTGHYWKYSGNADSNIPQYFVDMMAEDIGLLMRDRNIRLPDISYYIDANKDLGTSSDLSYIQRFGVFKRLFSHKKEIIAQCGSKDLQGEHIYFVISFLKNNGFSNIHSKPIKDVTQDCDKYPFEVESVFVNGTSFLKAENSYAENAEIVITYHEKQEITIPYAMKYFRKKNYIMVGDQLQDMGFTNIYERKIQDLKTGWIKKDGAVEQVLATEDGKEVPINEGQPYKFDTKIVITYHTF